MLIREDRPTINFKDSYRAHYAGHEDVVIHRIEPLTDQPLTLRLALACRREDFCHFMFQVEGEPAYRSRNNTFIIRFGEKRKWSAKATPVYAQEEGAVHDIVVELTTAEEYAQKGDPLPTRYNVKITPRLEFEAPTPESWSQPLPPKQDVDFAYETWGKHINDSDSDYEKAKALAKVLCHELWPCNGRPNRRFESPFDMYHALLSGESKGFCTQFNMIYVHACRCFGLIARNTHIERPVQYGHDAWVLLSGMHCGTEVFDRAMNRWIFIDIRFYCLGAYLGEEGPLTTGELHLFISQPHWRDRLRFEVYDMATGTQSRLPMEECPRPDIHFYSGWNTVFHVGFE